MLTLIGTVLARYLHQKSAGFRPSTVPVPLPLLRRCLHPGDVLLVEGDRKVSAVIKYITQSNWSHAAIYIGEAAGEGGDDPPCLLEADMLNGVVLVPLSKYAGLNTRICRPVDLAEADRVTLIAHLRNHLGMQYDIRNALDLARYLLPLPVPQRWRRRLLALGSGDPTRALCSTLIAQAFQSIHYPILPVIGESSPRERLNHAEKEIIHIRNYRLFAPRDFDISPYFRIIKPALEAGFHYKSIIWAENDGDKGN